MLFYEAPHKLINTLEIIKEIRMEILDIKTTQIDVRLIGDYIHTTLSDRGVEMYKIREKNKDCYLIFSTGHLEYAMMAYKLKTFDFITFSS